ncbi:hypothetical protein [Streptomyces sp. Ru72]|uniref:hypothetical protein n=1 Tax=Streptomyces sp. Ru72 TaxID=2080747 RepID=UPI000CDDFAB0|nr:hypothetical protein [Streptomyces sp. Ru72]POX45628.1 hypothetical protein C3488_29005 [Streptomyces sp. Ru72]
MRPRSAAALAVPVLSLLPLSLTGCSGGGTGGTESAATGMPAGSTSGNVDANGRKGGSEQAEPAEPRTPEEFLARARKAMSAEHGWTFAVKGNEGLVVQGRQNTATYTATVRRTQQPEALHSTGTTYTKGTAKPEEVYLVGGTGYVRKGGSGAQWKSGPLSDPEIADVVEDPIAALEAFRTYAREEKTGGGVSVDTPAGRAELRVTVPTATLPTVRQRAVVKNAVRELTPTLRQLRAAGVAAPESRIKVEHVEEDLTLDSTTYRITSHRFRCTFLIPYGAQSIRYTQDVTERTEGVFRGVIELPAGVR